MKEYEGTEADAMEDWADYDDLDYGEPFTVNLAKTDVKYKDGSIRSETVVKKVNGRVITSERQRNIKELYDIAKDAKVGTVITCPVCKEKHTKTTYHKVFCSNGRKSRKDCKSKYWNTIHPERLDRIF